MARLWDFPPTVARFDAGKILVVANKHGSGQGGLCGLRFERRRKGTTVHLHFAGIMQLWKSNMN
jgi:hypothetical protein